LVVCTWLAAALTAHAAQAGVIRGTVRLDAVARTPAYAPDPYAGHAGALPAVRPPARGLVGDAVVYVARLDAAVDSALTRDPSGHVLAQRNQAFSTRVLPCVAGSTVDFPNQDPIFHNVFSVSSVRRFDLGKYPQGHSKQVTFPKPGVVPVFCDIHPNMACFIVVLPNRAFTQPAADGSFTLPALPEGTYTVKVWHPDADEVSRTVKVPAAGDVTLDVAL
jgi:plastocyanin